MFKLINLRIAFIVKMMTEMMELTWYPHFASSSGLWGVFSNLSRNFGYSNWLNLKTVAPFVPKMHSPAKATITKYLLGNIFVQDFVVALSSATFKVNLKTMLCHNKVVT